MAQRIKTVVDSVLSGLLGDAEHAELRHLLVDFRWKALGFVEFGGDAADFAVGEQPRRFAHHIMATLCAAVCVSECHSGVPGPDYFLAAVTRLSSHPSLCLTWRHQKFRTI